MKMMTERYRGIRVRLVLPFRFLKKAKSFISLQPYLNPPIKWQKNDFLNKYFFLIIIVLIFPAGIFPGAAFGQMNLGQYEDEAPLDSWNISWPLSFAFARDAAAVSWNPALIHQLPDFTAAVSGFFSHTSLNKFAIVNTGVLTSRENPSVFVYGLESGAVSVRYKQWGFALNTGILEIYDRPALTAETKYEGSVQQRISFKQEGLLRSTNLSLAYAFGPRITAGIGFHLVSGSLERHYEDYYAHRDDLTISDTRAQSFSGIFITTGCTVVLFPGVTWAAVIRTPYEKKAEGESRSQYTIPGQGVDIQISSREDSRYRQPLAAGTGIKLRISSKFQAGADIAFFNWNQYKVHYFGLDQTRNFKNTVKAGLGAEYMSTLRLFGIDWHIPVWAGLQVDSQPMRDPASFYALTLFGTGIRTRHIFLHLNFKAGWEQGSGDHLQTWKAALTIGYKSE
jgi:hypothetical protein